MKQKILFSLDENELKQFRSLVNQSNLGGLKKLVNLVIEKENKDEYIGRRVSETLSLISGIDIEKIKDSQDLKWDLGLTIYHKRSLKIPFQRIVDDLGSNQIIAVKECQILVIVKDCITLIKSKV